MPATKLPKRPYKDWRVLLARAEEEGILDIVSFISSNTEDPRLRDGVLPGYHRCVSNWMHEGKI